MKKLDLERLVRKYYGYVSDLEGSGVEAFDLLFVRDRIQEILEESLPQQDMPIFRFEQIHELDHLLWIERATFLMVIGVRELEHARQQQRARRSHWWWYLDDLNVLPQPLREQRERLGQAFLQVSR